MAWLNYYTPDDWTTHPPTHTHAHTHTHTHSYRQTSFSIEEAIGHRSYHVPRK